MVTTTLGRTGLVVSRIGLGLAALGRPGYINIGHAGDLARDYDVGAMETRAHEVLDAAWAAGVRYFDAARSYGRAEAFLAGWLASRRVDPAEVVVGSKWGYVYTADWRADAEKHEVKDHSHANLLRQAAESRDLLAEHLDLYQIHSATLDSGVLDDPAVLAELARLKEGGPRIGLSLSGPRQAESLRRAMELPAAVGGRLFDVVQATWNLLEPSVGPALAEAHALGLGVIVKEVMANGRLSPSNDDPAFAGRRQALQAEADRLGTTLDAMALAAAMARPWADIVLSGAASINHLRSNVAAATVAWDPEAEGRLDSIAETPAEYWGYRSRLPWN